MKAKYLYDDFATTMAVSGKWYSTNAVTGVVQSGLMRIRPTSSYDYVESLERYDLTGSYFSFKLAQNCAKGLGSNELNFTASVDATNFVEFAIEGGRLLTNNAAVTMRETRSGVASATTFTYDPAVHVWFRIREASGTVYWETSVDGTAWTVRRSKTTTMTLTSTSWIMAGGYWDAEAGTTFATIDDFNLFAGLPGYELAETFTDNFATADPAKWSYDPAFVSGTSGGFLQLTATINYDAYAQTVDKFSLIGSQMAVQLAQPLPQGNGTFGIEIFAEVNGATDRVGFIIDSSYLYFQEKVAGVSSDVAIAFNPIRHKWFRVRESAGTVYWETSADGSLWVTKRSKAPALDLSGITLALRTGFYGTEDAGQFALFDNINLTNGNTITTVDPPLDGELLTEDFTTFDEGKWFFSEVPGSAAFLGGSLVLTPNLDYESYCISNDTWNLTSSHFAVKLAQIANPGLGSIEAQFGARVGTGNSFGFRIFSSGLVETYEQVGNVENKNTFSYNAANDKWFRVRGSSGSIFWETSIDGVSWVAQRSKTSSLVLTNVTCFFSSGFWDAETAVGVWRFDDLNIIDQSLVSSLGWRTQFALPMGGARDGGTLAAGFPYPEARWMWEPIKDNPELDPKSAAIIANLSVETGGAGIVGFYGAWEFGVRFCYPSEVKGLKRYPMQLFYYGDGPDKWGLNPYQGTMVPWNPAWVIPGNNDAGPGTFVWPPDGTESVYDGHVSIVDVETGVIHDLWQAWYSEQTDEMGCSWGGSLDMYGDGRVTKPGTAGSVATNLARWAGVIREDEIAAGEIPHALFFATNMAAPGLYRYPATKTDGFNWANQDPPILEGSRIQLDPSIDVDALPGLTKGDRIIAKALQRYGAYCGDNGGGRIGLLFEFPRDGTGPDWMQSGTVYTGAGWLFDYQAINIPWGSLRVLSNAYGGDPVLPQREIAKDADWLWEPIPDNPVLDPMSATWAGYFADHANSYAGSPNNFSIWEFGNTLVRPDMYDASTTRVRLRIKPDGFQQPQPEWILDWEPEGLLVPWKAEWRISGEDYPFELMDEQDLVESTLGIPVPDSAVALYNPDEGYILNLWRARFDENTNGELWCQWASIFRKDQPTTGQGNGRTDLYDMGFTDYEGSSTASSFQTYPVAVKLDEWDVGEINHALHFATDMAAPTVFRYPSQSTDGINLAGVEFPIPEGARVQLDPSIDLEAIPDITQYELILGKALQKYGAYCGDNGGLRIGFSMEQDQRATGPDDPGPIFNRIGMWYDYQPLDKLPWGSLRVLKNWDGSA